MGISCTAAQHDHNDNNKQLPASRARHSAPQSARLAGDGRPPAWPPLKMGALVSGAKRASLSSVQFGSVQLGWRGALGGEEASAGRQIKRRPRRAPNLGRPPALSCTPAHPNGRPNGAPGHVIGEAELHFLRLARPQLPGSARAREMGPIARFVLCEPRWAATDCLRRPSWQPDDGLSLLVLPERRHRARKVGRALAGHSAAQSIRCRRPISLACIVLCRRPCKHEASSVGPSPAALRSKVRALPILRGRFLQVALFLRACCKLRASSFQQLSCATGELSLPAGRQRAEEKDAFLPPCRPQAATWPETVLGHSAARVQTAASFRPLSQLLGSRRGPSRPAY